MPAPCIVGQTPSADPALRDAQRKWLEDALAKARSRNAAHIFVCGHHPWFTEAADEPDQYFNVPTAQRQAYLKLFEESGVDYVLAGHWHRNALARAGNLHMITTSSIAQPLGKDPSGLRVFRVYGDRVEQEFVPLGKAVGAAK